MMLADALAVLLGLWLGMRLPEKVVKYRAAAAIAAFAAFGALLIAQEWPADHEPSAITNMNSHLDWARLPPIEPETGCASSSRGRLPS